MLVHGQAKSEAMKLSSGAKLNIISKNEPCPSIIKQVATDFVELQKYRHNADYDFSMSFRKQDALLTYDRANRSLLAIEQARLDCNDALQALTMTLHGVKKY